MSTISITTVPEAVVNRFPHLRDKLLSRAAQDEEFFNLCNDYSAVVVTLRRLTGKDSRDREEFITLKNSLEVEILERLSQ